MSCTLTSMAFTFVATLVLVGTGAYFAMRRAAQKLKDNKVGKAALAEAVFAVFERVDDGDADGESSIADAPPGDGGEP